MLVKRTTDVLHDIFGFKFYNQKYGRLVVRKGDDVPTAMKVHGWLASVRQEVHTRLQGKPLKYDTNRHLIQFADDKVFDFEKQKALRRTSAYGHHEGFAIQVCGVPVA